MSDICSLEKNCSAARLVLCYENKYLSTIKSSTPEKGVQLVNYGGKKFSQLFLRKVQYVLEL